MFFKNCPFRIRYFLNHLLCSITIGCCTALVVYKIWYPGLLAKAIGVSHIFLLLLTIDVIVGPILTLFLAKEGKKGVWFDLTVVIIIQLTALVYGVWHIAEGRPIWQVINIYRVELITGSDDMNYQNASADYASASLLGPRWAMVRPYKDEKEKSEWLWKELEEGKSPARQAEMYQSIEGHWQDIAKEILPLNDLNKFNDTESVRNVLKKFPDADGFLPMIGKDWDMTVLVSNKSQKILGIADLRPWK